MIVSAWHDAVGLHRLCSAVSRARTRNVRSSEGRKPGEEIVECVSRLKAIQQRLDGHARTGEHWRSPPSTSGVPLTTGEPMR